LLRLDGRASIRSVAEQVHISRANAYARINRLMDDGVIRGFTARIDHERAGQGASAYITLKIVQNSWRTVREQLRQLPGASHIALVGGDFDVILLVRARDNEDLRRLVLEEIHAGRLEPEEPEPTREPTEVPVPTPTEDDEEDRRPCFPPGQCEAEDPTPSPGTDTSARQSPYGRSDPV
jgi:DNA-binding Lrp family transcriptional regulator